ncbi:S-layer glycoprotein N-glycosyltransferase AglJ [Halorarum salinum]|uniref:S-layer glycoprotein N-glycosyltransferase AglJ n=1 Tax=Halorarum salinum TaxID=2743089 RepID=A0A7D5QIJ4_9EURY|nr:S-layer glycoprotein N-glycosyltransferase AglJ [Halobaculum salinum]QLG63422.1 S-layer glycoprotein N-glycosyltransferase AglJ [Halobaculum salinum]
MNRDAVTVLLPAYDEAETVGDVVADFREHGFERVLVVDGESTDGTRARAEAAGARVMIQSGRGKGQAIREAVRERVDTEFVLMADADGTYRPEDADAMLEPLFEGRAEHVVGDRFANMHEDAMTAFNRVGNRAFNWLFGLIHREDFGDILSGYRAFTRDSFRRLALSADGFGIETELSVECARHGVPTAVVPVTYLPRPNGSNTNLHPVKDGGIILMAIYRQAKTSNPLFYFGSAGMLTGLFGVAVAAFVAYDWFVNGVPHEVLAVVSGVSLIFGVQLLIFGVLSDLIVTLHRETLDRIENDD